MTFEEFLDMIAHFSHKVCSWYYYWQECLYLITADAGKKESADCISYLW